MGKKAKIGKQRRDKYYHLAKETGYRSRAAFKLIQLNKRFEFLQRSRALVDLCAAPGGWMQVASQNMPVSSLCIGVDLVPIKAINNCLTIQGDITSEATRQAVRRELGGWEADCVLNDGAPNIGRNWTQDAFQQNCLTLSALRLATQILAKNGCFVTKVFRSSDYQALVSVFEKLFKQVHVWKPAASRLESAEIFVVCQKYLKPVKVDVDLLDHKKVFAETSQQAVVLNPQLMLQPRKKERKVQASGYQDDSLLALYKEINASDFIHSHNYLELLSTTSKILLDDSEWADDEATTEEVKNCFEDIKVCGPRELRTILNWRKKMLKKITEQSNADELTNDEEAQKDVDPEDERMEEIDRQLVFAKAEEKAALKKKKRKLLKEKADSAKRKQLKMLVEGDKYEIPEELELFSLKRIAKAKNSVFKGVDANEKCCSDSGVDDKSDDELERSAGDLLHEYDPGMSEFEKDEARKSKWFQRSEVAKITDNEDEALQAIEKFLDKNKHISNVKGEDEDSKLDDDDNVQPVEINTTSIFNEDETEEKFMDVDKIDDKYLTKVGTAFKENAGKQKLAPELLALGEQMIYSSKTRRNLEEWAWNRYTNNDDGLPDWFVEDEKKHFRKELPVAMDRVNFYENRMKDINTRTIKKVVEAKARKRRRKDIKLRQAKKRAEGILESGNMEHAEKLREVKKLYSKTMSREKKKVKYEVVTKGKRGTLTRPKGPYKAVDARLKKDNRREKSRNKTKSTRTKRHG